MRVDVFFILLFAIAVYPKDLVGEEPGVTVTMGANALASGLTIALPNVLTTELQNQTIASIAGTTRALAIFQITYNITDLIIYNFEFGDIDIQIIDEGFEIELSGIVCNVTFNWYYRDQSFLIIHVSDSGTGTLNFYDGTYSMKLKIHEDDGRPHFALSKNNLALGRVDLELDGGADWFYDLFNFIITPVVKAQVQDKVQDIVSGVFGALNNEIEKIPTTIPLVENIAFNWELLSDFDTDDDGFGSFYSAGYFVPQNNTNTVPPFAVQSLPSRVNVDNIQVVVSEFTFQSLGWALFEAGSLNLTIPFGTTSDWRLLLPALYRAYPDEPVQVNFEFDVYPTFTINSTGVTLQAVPYMNWNIVSNGTVSNAFTLLVQLTASVDLNFEENLLHGKVTLPTFELDLFSTNIGDFSLFQLETAINTALYVVLLPQINSVLRNGIPVPTVLGVTLSDPVIEFETGYLYLTGDVETNRNSTESSFYSLIPYPMLKELYP